MNRISKDENMLQKWVVLLLLMAVPALAWGQKKTSAPAPKAAPAQHASAPSHAAAPSHGATQSHGATAPHGATAGHTSTNSRPSTSHTTTASHGAAMAGHTTTPSRGNTTAGRGNTTPSRGNTTAGRGNTNAGRGNAAAANRGSARQPAGTRNVSLKGGGHASVRANGSIRSVDRNGMNIDHGLRGGRTVVSERNGARIVTRRAWRLCAARLRDARRARLLLANLL